MAANTTLHQEVPEKIETRLFINNEVSLPKIHKRRLTRVVKFVPSVAGKKFQLYNPATEEPTVEVYEAQSEDVDIAVNAAKKASQSWAETDGRKRHFIY